MNAWDELENALIELNTLVERLDKTLASWEDIDAKAHIRLGFTLDQLQSVCDDITPIVEKHREDLS